MKRTLSLILVAVIMVMSFTSCDLVNQFLGNQLDGSGDSGAGETRYTITAEEWDETLNMRNYTEETTGFGTYTQLSDNSIVTYPNDSFEEHTETSMHIEGVSIPGPTDFEYYITIKDGIAYRVNVDPDDKTVTSAYDYSWEPETFGNGLTLTFEDLTYDEVKKGYCASLEQYGVTANFEFYFENGKIVKRTANVDMGSMTSVTTTIITNIGTTVINVPEFTVEEYTE